MASAPKRKNPPKKLHLKIPGFICIAPKRAKSKKTKNNLN
jgi:hypothetical protein